MGYTVICKKYIRISYKGDKYFARNKYELHYIAKSLFGFEEYPIIEKKIVRFLENCGCSVSVVLQ